MSDASFVEFGTQTWPTNRPFAIRHSAATFARPVPTRKDPRTASAKKSSDGLRSAPAMHSEIGSPRPRLVCDGV